MRDKFTTPEFELDLSNIEITIEETNPRYKDYLSTKFTLPFDFNIDEHLSSKMSDYSSVQSLILKQKHHGLLTLDGRVKEATLNILSNIGRLVRGQIDLGFDEFPNANVKLNELPLETIESANGMVDKTDVISQKYPDVNYNFPMVYTDIYKDTDGFADFLGAYNNRENGVFYSNTNDAAQGVFRNENIIIPMPYLLYVLKTGVESAGFTLHGDVLTDDLLKKIIIAPSKKINLFKRPDTVEWLIGNESRTPDGFYKSEQGINHIGEFYLYGYVHVWNSRYYNGKKRYYTRIYLNDEVIWETPPHLGRIEVNLRFRTLPNVENKLKIIAFSKKKEENIVELKIKPVKLYDDVGNVKKESANLNKYNLAENLPDIDFINFITIIKNLFNLDWDIRGSEVWMNRIDRAFDKQDLKNISYYEVENPERIYNQTTSFLLHYKDVDSDEYKSPKIFYGEKGIQHENYTEDNNTNRIEINALPLPEKTKEGKKTAYQFMEDESTLQLILYEGLNDGENTTSDNTELMDIDRHFMKYHKRWFDFRLNSNTLKWVFYVNKNHWRGISTLDNLYAYKRKLWVESISKRSVNHKTYEITLQASIV